MGDGTLPRKSNPPEIEARLNMLQHTNFCIISAALYFCLLTLHTMGAGKSVYNISPMIVRETKAKSNLACSYRQTGMFATKKKHAPAVCTVCLAELVNIFTQPRSLPPMPVHEMLISYR